MARIRKAASALFDAINLEGNLISPAMLVCIAARKAGGQAEADYGVPKGLTLRDEIARFFRIGQALFSELFASPAPAMPATVGFVQELLRDVFGFSDVCHPAPGAAAQSAGVTLEALRGRVPVVVVPPGDDLDHASPILAMDGRRRSAASAIQDWVNVSDNALWGMCSNGERLRLVRDNASLTRPAYVEVNLRQFFEGEDFADFTAIWLLIHASRFGVADSSVTDCALERWREAGSKEGLVARERLGAGVEAALLALGNGFLAHPDNAALRERLESGRLPLKKFFEQLLRLVYRLIFLLAAEDRGLLHPPGVCAATRRLYAEGYSVGALRDRAVRRTAWDSHHDRWEGLLVTFRSLMLGEPRLGLPALGGLFDPNVIRNLEDARLSNRTLMEAIYRLAWLKDANSLVQVNWRDMETEELGSVYEGLLELTPRLIEHGRGFAFAEGAEAKGNARKTTGSYYTPDSLVQALLDSALDPVLNRVETEAEDPAKALLEVTVIDPACGSGHFLLAAARRIATRVARVRAQGIPSLEDYRRALRDVTRCCIHGVDRNPMAVELTKVALWIETVEPGKPLGFLDASLRCGDALLGLFDLEVLRDGIPDAAYKPLAGDDKATAKYFEKCNKAEREGQGALDFTGRGGRLPHPPPLADAVRALRNLPEDNPEQIAEKRERFDAVQGDPRRSNWNLAADAYMTAFLSPKVGGVPHDGQAVTVPTTEHVWRALSGQPLYSRLVGEVQELATHARTFHWPLEFPDVIAAGGFDVALGNPPWERIKLQEQEFFAGREPDIAQAPNAAARERMIARLADAEPDTRERALYDEFETTKRISEASSVFARESGRFPLAGCGDVNTYALFAELFTRLASPRGRAGVVVPTGIATDATTASFFATLIDGRRLANLVDFENRIRLFPGIDSRIKFSLLTIGSEVGQARFSFFLTNPAQLLESERSFSLSRTDIVRINPNTKTVPVFRSRSDAELTAKIYDRVPVLVRDSGGAAGNPWGVSVSTRLWHMAEDSGSFVNDAGDGFLPVYEAKMIHQFDHRFFTYGNFSLEKADPACEPLPRYWVPRSEVEARLMEAQNWTREWLMGWRDITNATNERTVIAAIMPRTAVGHTCPLLFTDAEPRLAASLLGNLNALVLDFVARQKVGGTHLTYTYIKQFPFLPPARYSERDLGFIVSRVIELTFTSCLIAAFARDLGYDGPPFRWDEDRRARLRAELDAWYARAYDLTRDELRYILDPADLKGPDYPSETFRVLKNNEIKKFGEYRTARLVLEAWDRMAQGETLDISPAIEVRHIPIERERIAPVDPATLPDNAWAAASDSPDAALAQLAAVVKALPAPTPISIVRLAALYAIEPRYLTSHLSGEEQATWRRLVGSAAESKDRENVATFVPKIDANWRDAVTQLRGMGAIIENVQEQTWTPGIPVNEFETSGWPDGRATFVLRVLESMTTDDATADLPPELLAWVNVAYAA